MKSILLIGLFVFNLIANECESEKLFWDEIKNSKDIEDYKYYNKKYPNGTFQYLADKNIKQLRKFNNTVKLVDEKPIWLKGYTKEYKYYGVGIANKHFKGIHYQENLALSRAKRILQDKFDDANTSYDTQSRYYNLIQKRKYIDEKGRVYILVYIDNYDL